MSDIQELEHRITELEIQTALQEDLIGSLNDTIAKMQQALDLQQGQLRWIHALFFYNKGRLKVNQAFRRPFKQSNLTNKPIRWPFAARRFHVGG